MTKFFSPLLFLSIFTSYPLQADEYAYFYPKLHESLWPDFCGKGIKIGARQAGSAGYQEIVDFKEFIGYAVDRGTKEKFATSWGKIHYAKDGIHIVPTKPRL